MDGPLDKNSFTSEFGPVMKKWVCKHCKQEFQCGKGLGGHIRVHYQNQRKTNYTGRKKIKRTAHVRSSTAPPSHSRNISYNCRKNKMKQNSGGGSDEVIDLSKSLSGFGWRGHRKRGCTCIEAKIIASTNCDDQEDSYDMTERFNDSAHRIACTTRYMCETCNVVLPTYHAVLCHVNGDIGSSSLDSANDDGSNEGVVAEQEGDEIGAEQEEDAADDDGKEEEGEGKSEEDDDDKDDDDEKGAEEEKQDGDDETRGAEDEEIEGVDGEAPIEEVGVKTLSMEDDEVADLEEAGNGAKATGEANKVAGEEERVGSKACTQVDEACDNNGGSMDQNVSTSDSNPPRMLDFDLNEIPPEED